MALDEKDTAILSALQEDAKARTSDLAKRLNIPITTVHNRIKRMEAEKIITGYAPTIDWERVGRAIHAMIFVTGQPADKGVDQEDLAKQLMQIPGVERVYILTGAHDLVMHVHLPSVRALDRLLIKSLRPMSGIEKTETVIVLDEFHGPVTMGPAPG